MSNWHKRRRNIRIPLIDPRVVDEYLARKLENHDWVKTVPRIELEKHAYDLGHRFASPQPQWNNQLACFALGAANPAFLFFLKMGGGKTSILLNQIRFRKKRGELARALVLVPYLLHVGEWENGIREHAPDLSYRLLLGDHEERMSSLKTKTDLCVMNYAGLMTYMAEKVKNKKTKKVEMKVDPVRASEFAALFNFVGFDESHRLGNHQGLPYDMCRWLTASCFFRYALSGTPFGRDPTRLWPQFRLVDEGETLGATLGIFRSVFFSPEEDKYRGLRWDFKKETTPELHRIIKHRSITYELKELKDVPRKVAIRIPVRLEGEGAAYYRRIIQGIRESRGDYGTLESAFTRMRQCASGFIAMRADDASRIEVQFRTNPKMDRLRELILTKEDEKILVFHDFIPSAKLIEEMLEESKIKFASLRGRMKDINTPYQRFLREDSCRIFVLNNQLGSECINPQKVARRIAFYESPVDPVIRAQAEARVHRPGQEEFSFIHDLVVKGTIEEKILKYVREGENLLKAVLSGYVDELLAEDEE